jgi:hypothetical protein
VATEGVKDKPDVYLTPFWTIRVGVYNLNVVIADNAVKYDGMPIAAFGSTV